MSDFKIDSQTINDLNIFTEHTGSTSLFDLFKLTRTMGARVRLKEIMQTPSSDVREILLRRDAICFFHQYQIKFDVRNEEIDLIDFYLKSERRKSKSNLIDAGWDYLNRNSSNDFYITTTGLKYLIRLTRYLYKFVEEYRQKEPPEYLASIFERIETIIQNGKLKDAIQVAEDKLKFFQVNKFDSSFRGIEKQQIDELLHIVYEFDVFENIAIVAKRKGFSFAEYDQGAGMRVDLKGMFHPSLTNPVSNDIIFDGDKNVIFLTGSNMAGKSSFLKSLGLAIYLSHLGFPVPAKYMKITLFNGLITTINLPDSIQSGFSHYYSEVHRVKEVSQQLMKTDRLFVVFDELFRGTNVKDAFDASSLILTEISKIRNSAFFISTHIVELAAELQQFDNISFRYMETYFEDTKPKFTYLLKEGVSVERLGLYIVQNEGIVEILRAAANTR